MIEVRINLGYYAERKTAGRRYVNARWTAYRTVQRVLHTEDDNQYVIFRGKRVPVWRGKYRWIGSYSRFLVNESEGE